MYDQNLKLPEILVFSQLTYVAIQGTYTKTIIKHIDCLTENRTQISYQSNKVID